MAAVSNSFHVHFYIRQNKNRNDDYSAYCSIKMAGSGTKQICVLRSIKRADWDLGKVKPKQINDHLIKLSLHLDAIKAKLFDIYFDLTRNSAEISAERIKNIYLGKDEPGYTILWLIDIAIKKYQKELAPGSLKNYGATRDYVEGFCRMKYKSGDVSLKFLTYAFIEEFKTYILSNPIKPNDPCTNNGCMKHLERIKKIITWASEMRFIDRDIFSSFKIKKNPFESPRLHWRELQLLENKNFQRPILNIVKDLFVFSCYTGLAPADVQALMPHQIHTDVNGITWLSYCRAKSKVPASVPLLSPALAIINKYKWKKGDFHRTTTFPFVTNKDLNDNLKIISEICEFGISLNFYIARYTFATTVTILNGVPITSLNEMMGHKKIESTLHYARADKSTVARDMQLLEDKLQANQATT